MINPNIFWHVLQLLIFVGLSLLFTQKVFENSLCVSKTKFWILASFHMLLIAAITSIFFTQVSPLPDHKWFGGWLILGLTIVFYKIVTHKKLIFLLFVLFLLVNVQLNAFFLARATLDFKIFPVIHRYVNGDLLVLASIYCIGIFCIVYFSLYKYYKTIVEQNIVSKHTKLFFCLPALFFVSLAIFGSIIYQTQGGMTKRFLVPLLLINIFAFSAYYATLKSTIDDYYAALERERLSAAQNQISLWQSQYENLQLKIATDARARHDWRQHIIAIMGYVESKDLDGLEEYVSEYKEKYLFPDRPPVCDILPLNLLFQYYQHKADENNISLTVCPVSFAGNTIPVTDLTIVFGNLLENAIEACSKLDDTPKTIRLKINRGQNRISFVCENTFLGVLSLGQDKIISSKQDGGIGLSSVQGIVEKYNGHMKIKTGTGLFKIYAFLQDTP